MHVLRVRGSITGKCLMAVGRVDHVDRLNERVEGTIRLWRENNGSVATSRGAGFDHVTGHRSSALDR